MADPQEIEAQLNLLREQYKRTLTGILDELEASVKGASPDGVSSETIAAWHASLHRLTGSGATFGFPVLSSLSRSLEIQAKQWLESGGTIDVGAWPTWRSSVLGLRQSVSPPATTAEPNRINRPASTGSAVDGRINLALIADDAPLAVELAEGLGQFGYQVTTLRNVDEFSHAAFSGPPAVVVMDVLAAYLSPQAEGDDSRSLFEQIGRMVPTVLLSGRTDFPARLAAARIGAGAVLPKPVDVPALAAQIEALLKGINQPPFRVLIVDDDDMLAEHYRLTLVSAGMLAERVSRPTEVMAALERLHPDLVLLDLYMPECSGAILARAVRYDPAWEGVPIIYLSAESDLGMQVEALGSGADDFLTKPISDEQLVATVRVRAARARKITELMSQDSLTGLLKHASIKERLAQEFDRTRRQGKPLCMVMVDMDHFKRVNDSYGHPAGDQVIRTLAHLLRQRMRRQDSIGRYGGEEFAAVLADCSAEDACRLLEDIRARFGEIPFMHGARHFNVTLSAGIACSDSFNSAGELLTAADAALYAAKRGGRNQIRLADEKACAVTDAERALRGT